MNKVLLGLLIFVWGLHFIGIFVPETGFDAVWYHLPLVQAMATQLRLVYVPDLYQSVNPLLGELFFVPGWLIAREVGVKSVAYLFGLLTLGVTWLLARRFIQGSWLLVCLIFVSLMQVVTWQTSSAYVDLMKAFWELLAVLLMMHGFSQSTRSELFWWGAAFAWSASLATKLFSLLLVPYWWLWLYKSPWPLGRKIIMGLCIFVLALPFYWWAYIHTGNPFYSLMVHTQNVGQIGAADSFAHHMRHQVMWIWTSPWDLLVSRDYVNWIVVLALPLTGYYVALHRKSADFRLLTSFVFWQWLIWWFVPPVSTRYAVAGFIGATILTVAALRSWAQKSRFWYWAIVLTIAMSMLFHITPRLMVFKRQSAYILGKQTKTEYIRQFYDGTIDQHLERWYQTR